MKKILLLAIYLTAISCNTAKDPGKDFNGDVKVRKEFIYDASEKFGEPTVGELFFSRISEWESDGKIIKIESYDKGDGELLSVLKIEYNDKGQEVESYLYDRDGRLKETRKFEYNNNGEDVKSSSFDSDGKLKSVVKPEYNDEGEFAKHSYYDSDGKLKSISTFEYNDNGDMTAMSLFGDDGELQYTSEYKYTKFDNENNWLEREEYQNSEITSIAKREFTYW